MADMTLEQVRDRLRQYPIPRYEGICSLWADIIDAHLREIDARKCVVTDEICKQAAKVWSGAPFPSKASTAKARRALESIAPMLAGSDVKLPEPITDRAPHADPMWRETDAYSDGWNACLEFCKAAIAEGKKS